MVRMPPAESISTRIIANWFAGTFTTPASGAAPTITWAASAPKVSGRPLRRYVLVPVVLIVAAPPALTAKVGFVVIVLTSAWRIATSDPWLTPRPRTVAVRGIVDSFSRPGP